MPIWNSSRQLPRALASITDYDWDVESNGVYDYNGDSISHNYPTHGQYAVRLKVTDALGCRDSVTHLVTVYPMPSADFEGPPVCFNEVTSHYDSSSVATGNIQSWAWNFGDGSSSSTQNPAYTFGTSGFQSVQLTVTSDGGCVDSLTKNILVYHLPEALFETTPNCENLPVEFTQASTSQSGNLSVFEWDFGDGNGALSSGPLHDYAAPGLYDVTLQVTTQFGCKDTAMDKIRIYPAPQAAFGWGQ